MPSSETGRREFLMGALVAAGAEPLCCTTAALPADSFIVGNGEITVSLARAPQLRRVGTAFAVVDRGRQLNLILIHAERDRYVAMDRSCTHGGAQCTYNPKRHTVRCTSLNHAEYDMQGVLLHGRTHGNLRTYPARTSGSTVVIELERKA